MKVFGSYGEFYDIMKLNVAISSFGGQYWNTCAYALDTPEPRCDRAGRTTRPDAIALVPQPATGANFAGGTTPAGLTFLENQNFRTFPTPVRRAELRRCGPGLKPYKQHESVFGVDYQLAKTLAFEARWDRRRLDHVIEDSPIRFGWWQRDLRDRQPGSGNRRLTFNSFYNFLYPRTANCATARARPTV